MPDRAWYYSSRGQQQGPINGAQLKQLATSGRLQPSDLVWTDSMETWSPASSVKGLFAAEPAPAAATPTMAPQAAIPTAPAAQDANPAVQTAASAYAPQFQAATQLAGEASRNAMGALKSLVRDPVGGIGQAFRQLSNAAALQVGIAFLVLFVVLVVVAALIDGVSMPAFTFSSSGAKEFFKGLVALLAMVAAMAGVAALYRVLTRSSVSLAADLFIVGASLLPMGVFAVLSSLLNVQSRVVGGLLMALLIFAMTFTALMLYSGFTQILRLSERLASLAVPSVLVAGAAAIWLISWLFG